MRKMQKISLAIVALILIIAVIICFPRFENFDKTLQAFKVDASGEIIHTVDIQISGIISFFLGSKSLHTLSIDGFDGHAAVKNIDISAATQLPNQKYKSITFGISNISLDTEGSDFSSPNAQSYACDLAFSQDLEYLFIRIRDDNEPGVSYLASFSNQHTEEELILFFNDYYR